MPTNFPTSVDNFTNPTANDSLNLPSHSTQHANANDAIEAIEGYLLNGGQGLNHINTTTFTAATNVSLNNVFSSTYDNYKIILNVSASVGTDAAVSFRYRASGSDISTSTYVGQRLLGFNTSVITGLNAFGTSLHSLSLVTSARADLYYAAIELQNPFLARKKLFRTEIHTADSTPTYYLESHAGWNTTSTSFDGFSIFYAGTSFTGTVRVYGYRNS